MISADDDHDTQDYHKLPEPKGPSVPNNDRTVQRCHAQTVHMTAPQRQVMPPDETDRQRWARVKVQGWAGLRPADFQWLLDMARDKIF